MRETMDEGANTNPRTKRGQWTLGSRRATLLSMSSTVERGVGMSRVSHLSRDQVGASPVYLFEGGMAREHRTPDSKQLINKIRLSCLFASNILVHSGNIFEEPALFDAIKADKGL